MELDAQSRTISIHFFIGIKKNNNYSIIKKQKDAWGLNFYQLVSQMLTHTLETRKVDRKDEKKGEAMYERAVRSEDSRKTILL